MNNSPMDIGISLIRRALHIACLAVLMCGTIAACAPETESEAARAASSQALFAENCGPCHGAEGRGPALSELRALNPEELRSAMRDHPTAGQIPQRLPATDVQKLIEFIEQ